MKLREDSDQYCMILIGTIIMSAYIFDLLLSMIADSAMALHFPFLAGGPLIMVFFLVGYLKPKRSKIKVNMLSMAIVIGLLYTIYVTILYGSDLIYASWGMGAAILLAGGFSMLDSMEVSVTPGIMEVSDLKYRPEPEDVDESEVEGETPAESAEGEAPETVEETPAE